MAPSSFLRSSETAGRDKLHRPPDRPLPASDPLSTFVCVPLGALCGQDAHTTHDEIMLQHNGTFGGNE